MLDRLLTLVLLIDGVAGSLVSDTSTPVETGLENTDCQLHCPTSNTQDRIVLPAITQVQNRTGAWENVLECWLVDTMSTNLPGIDNAFQLKWEAGFDAAYQYIFYGPSFMPSHPAPESSLIIMSRGIGDLRVPSGKCLRVSAGDIFFSVGTKGRQTAWWSEDAVVSDFYFKDGKIPDHIIIPEVCEGDIDNLTFNEL